MVQASDQPQSAQSARRFFVLTEKVIGAAIEVHRHLGPGMLESAYEACLTQELVNAGLSWSDRRSCQSCTKVSALMWVSA